MNSAADELVEQGSSEVAGGQWGSFRVNMGRSGSTGVNWGRKFPNRFKGGLIGIYDGETCLSGLGRGSHACGGEG